MLASLGPFFLGLRPGSETGWRNGFGHGCVLKTSIAASTSALFHVVLADIEIFFRAQRVPGGLIGAFAWRYLSSVSRTTLVSCRQVGPLVLRRTPCGSYACIGHVANSRKTVVTIAIVLLNLMPVREVSLYPIPSSSGKFVWRLWLCFGVSGTPRTAAQLKKSQSSSSKAHAVTPSFTSAKARLPAPRCLLSRIALEWTPKPSLRARSPTPEPLSRRHEREAAGSAPTFRKLRGFFRGVPWTTQKHNFTIARQLPSY